ncbi:unnamed protein product (macronuclear) [Paramecium tetraurelia]|uniref:2-(3-amino-3-carboxypropyl)histidine synthase n=1 Tax=Paramecium tetraurelia TaxID=5888 RepID=A0DIG8_PARTE|nr:uncharacterized protein GSPATT00017207001 [Paramecium tetraurelia]CAK82835.1 unnamed protein product [Paramecium tetraurelia]|eukprot:XP_001450232.1 hypothetical protein (macronuclear) [Paramecium tetraurelia strain d4-2]
MYRIDNLNLENFEKIVIQFPSNQLQEAQTVWRQLSQKYPNKQFIISADPLHSSCCVNVIGARHIKHDLIIHFGETCFSEAHQENIMYVLPYFEYDSAELIKSIDSIEQSSWVLFDQKYDHILIGESKHIFLSFQGKLNQQQTQHIACGYHAAELRKQLIFIGSEDSELLQRFILHFEYGKIEKCYIIDPTTCQLQILQINQMPLIIKRTKQVEEASECKCFGILINNSTAKYTKNAYKACKQILKNNQKKYFTFSMNSLNEAKLGNFPEIEAYIIISCYRNSIIDTKKYYKLIITPFQLLQAFSDVKYIVESDLSLLAQEQQLEGNQEVQNEQINKQEESTALLAQNNENQLIALDKIFQTLDFYKNRQYQGLQIRENLEPAQLEIGLTGIASCYEKEGNK